VNEHIHEHIHEDATGPLEDLFPPVSPHEHAAVREVLARRASEDGLVDVAYREVDSPLGPLLLAATTAGLVRLAFQRQGFDAALDELARKVSPRVLRVPHRLDPAARELEEYFAGTRTDFDLPLDLTLAPGFRRTVLGVLRGIGFGATRSYAGVAALAGSPRAVRAVGTACARNPLPLVVPCHRVVRSDGTSGQYAGGERAKARLLAMEGPGRVGLAASGDAAAEEVS
jgi:methylated-DNA-[protein]-cysteine S-methyltransferase